MVCACEKRKEFITLSPTMVEVTSFKLLDSQILSVPVLIDSSDHMCIVDIQSIDVVDQCILDNVEETKLAWERLTLLYRSCCLSHLVLHHYL